MNVADLVEFPNLEAWHAEAARLFGDDQLKWRFVCPSCGHVAAVEDWKDAGAPPTAVAFSCVGRWTGSTKTLGQKPGPCNYAGGGLFGLNPVSIAGVGRAFAFATTGHAPRESEGGNG